MHMQLKLMFWENLGSVIYFRPEESEHMCRHSHTHLPASRWNRLWGPELLRPG